MKIKKGTWAVLLLILAAGVGLYFAYYNRDIASLPAATTGSTLAELWTVPGSSRASTTRSANTSASTSKATTTAKPKNPSSGYPYAQEYGIYPAEAKIPANKYLVLVNCDYYLPAKFEVKTEICVDNVYPEYRKMETKAAAQYGKMYAAAMEEKIELIPFSAYRTTAQQKVNFDREIKRLEDAGLERQEAVGQVMESVQPPGCSEHETGLAIDITRKGVWKTDPGFHGTKEFKWLEEHAHEYGFILRYPRGKEALTGVEYEPWHWRYVGKEDAEKIKEGKQCLEEYLKID